MKEELNEINAKLEELLQKGGNDERLVTRKREIEKALRVNL